MKKAVILTAGLGTRFLPVTKVVPKALLPIGNKPIIHYLVEEAIESGIEEVVIVISPGQSAIADYFKNDEKLAAELEQRGKSDLLDEDWHGIKIHFVTQEKALGDANAILCAKEFLAGEPFGVLFGDDIIKSQTPALAQLISIYKEKQCPVICAERVPKEEISSYGVIEPKSETNPIQVAGLIEKPTQEEAPSDLAVIGKYVCTPEVLTYMETAESSHPDGELRLIDAFRSMLADGKEIAALEIEGQRFDAGQPSGLLKANLAYSQE